MGGGSGAGVTLRQDLALSAGDGRLRIPPNCPMTTTTAAYAELLLKTSPPRAPRHQLARPRLGLDEGRFRDVPVVVVQAPPGFGKTSLIAQWRREHLAHGAAVAWFTADSR